MPHHWRPLAHERNSIFKCKQHTSCLCLCAFLFDARFNTECYILVVFSLLIAWYTRNLKLSCLCVFLFDTVFMRKRLSVVWHLSLPLIDSFNKTEAAIFPMLYFLWYFLFSHINSTLNVLYFSGQSAYLFLSRFNRPRREQYWMTYS